MKKNVNSFLIFTMLGFLSQTINAQKTNKDLADNYNVITPAVPFLVIAPDSRSGAMGELGAATEPDVWSMHWNPSKYSFMKKDFGGGLSYTPWLRKLGIKDVNQVYMSGYSKVGRMQTIGASFQYFNLGTVYFTNSDGIETGDYFSPREFAIDVAYSRLLSKDFSLAISLRYIYSNLSGNTTLSDGSTSHAGKTVASDISGYYQKQKDLAGIPTNIRFGFNISNVGGKISYTDAGSRDFLPATLRLGAGSTFKLDASNDLGINIEASKLLVQTPKVPLNGIEYGSSDQEASVPVSIINSFTDAPGGIKEEWHEVMWSAGLEYWYVKQFALRAGYFYENQTKGNRKFFTVGLGLRMSTMGFDAAYIIPSTGSNSPLADTWRIALTFDIENSKKDQTAQQPVNN